MAEVAGLYAITPEDHDTPRLLARVSAALDGGARLLQYRNKTAGAELRREQAEALLSLCARFQVPLIINDSLELALSIGAAGCHLGRDDGDVGAARNALGKGLLLGVSCYGSLDRARAARAQGADYVAFGSIFASSSKPAAARAPLALFADARRLGIDCPLVGIGGITRDNVAQLIRAGANAAAVISDLFAPSSSDEVRARARTLADQFRLNHPSSALLT